MAEMYRFEIGTLLVIVPPLAAQRRGRQGRIEKDAYDSNTVAKQPSDSM